MQKEIERKFLVKKLPDNLEQYKSFQIQQGYLANDKALCQVRVRAKDAAFTITLKKGKGLVREETEVPITKEQFDSLWPASLGHQLKKRRYEIPYGSYTIELDIFAGKNTGVVFAEVEFKNEEQAQAFTPPDWFSQEITGDSDFSNFSLAC